MQMKWLWHSVSIMFRLLTAVSIHHWPFLPTGAWTNGGGMVNPGKLLFKCCRKSLQPIFMRGQLTAGLRVTEDDTSRAYNTGRTIFLRLAQEVSNACWHTMLLMKKSSCVSSRLMSWRRMLSIHRCFILEFKHLSWGYHHCRGLLNAEISQVQEQFTKLQSIVNLYKALGGGAK